MRCVAIPIAVILIPAVCYAQGAPLFLAPSAIERLEPTSWFPFDGTPEDIAYLPGKHNWSPGAILHGTVYSPAGPSGASLRLTDSSSVHLDYSIGPHHFPDLTLLCRVRVVALNVNVASGYDIQRSFISDGEHWTGIHRGIRLHCTGAACVWALATGTDTEVYSVPVIPGVWQVLRATYSHATSKMNSYSIDCFASIAALQILRLLHWMKKRSLATPRTWNPPQAQ